jgi:ketosteroid isomerase-like protein
VKLAIRQLILLIVVITPGRAPIIEAAANDLTVPRADTGDSPSGQACRGRKHSVGARRELTMSERERNIEHVKKGYEAFSAGDIESLISLLDDNIEWVHPGESAISGAYHGKGEFGEFLRRFAEKSTTVEPRRFLGDGDTVVVLSDVTAGNEKGQDAEVYAIRDGKTVRAQVYTDTAMMERVYGKKRVAGTG